MPNKRIAKAAEKDTAKKEEKVVANPTNKVPETDYLVTVPNLTVCQDKAGEYMSCYLLCVDCGDANKNKYYVIQSLTDGKGKYYFHTRFGRVGYNTGANNNCEPAGSLDDVIKQYNKTKKAKTGKSKGYTEVQMSLGKPKDISSELVKKEDNRPVAPTKLDPKVYELMKFITNKDLMTKAVINAGFDVKKVPLSELSLQTLEKANKVLKSIEEALKKNDSG